MDISIILLEKMPGLGQLGDKVTVKPGYWRNYLLPQGKAWLATPENSAKIEERRAELEKVMAEKLVAAKTRAASLNDLAVTLSAKTLDEGKLYGSLGVRELVDAIASATGITLEKSEIHLKEGAIRTVGEHDVEAHLHPDVVVSIKVNVVSESA